jgi:hypothetical protein
VKYTYIILFLVFWYEIVFDIQAVTKLANQRIERKSGWMRRTAKSMSKDKLNM